MTYKEAEIYSKKVKWKVDYCNTGKECWCRVISPIEEINTEDGDSIRIINSGALSKTYARHIVKLHNNYIDSL
jgi:hypothetical protein